jgi:hypothetical protein
VPRFFLGACPGGGEECFGNSPREDQFARNSLRLGVCLYPDKSIATPVPRDESEICSRTNWRTLIFMSCNMSSMCLARELMRFAGSSLRPARPSFIAELASAMATVDQMLLLFVFFGKEIQSSSRLVQFTD